MASQAGQFQHLRRDEEVARCTIYPKHFDQYDVFSSGALVLIEKLDNSKKPSYAISTASLELLSSSDEVHDYGCRMAAHKNYAAFKRNGVDAPLDKRSFYCGYFHISVASAQGLARAEYQIEVLLVPENDEPAHCEIRLIPDQALTQGNLKDARTDLMVALSRLLRNPACRMCPGDNAYAAIVTKAMQSLMSANQNGVPAP